MRTTCCCWKRRTPWEEGDPGERNSQGRITSKIDYRVLQPALVTDPNNNRWEVRFNNLGMVVGTAVKGKTQREPGGPLDGFAPDLTDQETTTFWPTRRPVRPNCSWGATTRVIYDVDRSNGPEQPPFGRHAGPGNARQRPGPPAD